MLFEDLEKGDIIKIKKEKAEREMYGWELIDKKLRVRRVENSFIGPTIFFFNNNSLHFHDDEDIFQDWFDIVELIKD